jgi:DNA-binding GntR family transcriptional regulator
LSTVHNAQLNNLFTNMIKIDPQIIDQVRSNHNLSDLAYFALRDAIHSGDIKPGEPLRQEELAHVFAISPRTIRETLKRLVAEGLATYEPHKGVKVVELSAEDQEELFAMRGLLEGLALDYAFDRLTSEDLEHMKEILPLTAYSFRSTSVSETREYNREFHWVIINASGKPHLIRTLDRIWKLIFTYYHEYDLTQIESEKSRARDLGAHTMLIEALEARDLGRSREIIVQHSRSVGYRAMQIMEGKADPMLLEGEQNNGKS